MEKNNLLKNENRVLVVKLHHCSDKLLLTFRPFLFYCYFTNSLPKSIILLKLKTLWIENLSKTVKMILAFLEAGKLYAQIADQVQVFQQSAVLIIHHVTRIQT